MFPERLAEAAGRVQALLDAELARQPEPDGRLVQAMRYAVAGGKRLRGFLVLEGARLHGIPPALAQHPAAAIEAMHAYSLIHDDLPCMDDDDLRRGQPTVHRRWDEATAVLAGDALQSFAFELLCGTGPTEPSVILRLARDLALAAGPGGMVQGQMMDIAAETAEVPLALDRIRELQSRKTGALFDWAARCGPILAGADDGAMRVFARTFGLAFQIADDLLDVQGDAAAAGKRVGKDAAKGKATFVSLLGVAGAQRMAEDLVQQAEAALDGYGAEARALRECARYAIARDR